MCIRDSGKDDKNNDQNSGQNNNPSAGQNNGQDNSQNNNQNNNSNGCLLYTSYMKLQKPVATAIPIILPESLRKKPGSLRLPSIEQIGGIT